MALGEIVKFTVVPCGTVCTVDGVITPFADVLLGVIVTFAAEKLATTVHAAVMVFVV